MWKFLLVAVLALVVTAHAQNYRPIIGILTQPAYGAMAKHGNAYIAASYVKFVESGGARAVPVFHNSTAQELAHTLGSLNGLLLPGGGADFAGVYGETLKTIWQLMLKYHSAGDYFPVWGTCMGFQQIGQLASGNNDLLKRYDSWNISLHMDFVNGARNSRLFKNMNQRMFEIMSKENVTMNNHHWGIGPEDWDQVSQYLTILTTNVDRKGKPFVSTFEGKNNFPVYGVQWHPEKALFEWSRFQGVNHQIGGVLTTQYMHTFFVQEARRSLHKFASIEEEAAALIYNYNPVYTGKVNTHSGEQESDFMQTYFFNLL